MKMIDLKISKYLNLLRYSTKSFDQEEQIILLNTQNKGQFLLINKDKKQ